MWAPMITIVWCIMHFVQGRLLWGPTKPDTLSSSARNSEGRRIDLYHQVFVHDCLSPIHAFSPLFDKFDSSILHDLHLPHYRKYSCLFSNAIFMLIIYTDDLYVMGYVSFCFYYENFYKIIYDIYINFKELIIDVYNNEVYEKLRSQKKKKKQLDFFLVSKIRLKYVSNDVDQYSIYIFT